MVLVDDVLYTGRTIRAAIDALFDYGRPRACSSPCWSTGATASCHPPRLRGEEPADRPPGAHQVRLDEVDGVDEIVLVRGGDMTRRGRSRAGERASGRGGRRADTCSRWRTWSGRHRAHPRAPRNRFAEVMGRQVKKVATLRGHTVISVFFEPSTRTSTSFELAAKRLSADVVSIKGSGSAWRRARASRTRS